MTKTLIPAALAVLAAIVVTSAMDAMGLTLFSALALFPMLVLCWWFWRRPPKSMGFVWGRLSDYAMALAYPVVVLVACVLVAYATGGTHVEHTHWRRAEINFVLLFVQGIPIGLITEEGFFRGWLWASFEKAGLDRFKILILTSVAFALWHISLVTLAKGFMLPPAQAALYILNVAVIGVIWGQMRSISHSIVVTSVSHALWNAGTYVLFGTGFFMGVLGVKQTEIYGAEVGVVGLTLNVAFAAVLWWLRWRNGTSRLEEKSYVG